MKIYVVIEDIDDYPECGGGEYPDAVFLNYVNAEKYATKKRLKPTRAVCLTSFGMLRLGKLLMKGRMKDDTILGIKFY